MKMGAILLMMEIETGSPYARVRRLAALVRRLRLERNLSRSKVARHGGIGASTINQLEHVLDGGPLVGLPTPDTLRAIARGLTTNGLGSRNCEAARQIHAEMMQEVGYCDPPVPGVVAIPRIILDRLARLGGADIEIGLTGRPWTEQDITNTLRAIDEAERRHRVQDSDAEAHTA